MPKTGSNRKTGQVEKSATTKGLSVSSNGNSTPKETGSRMRQLVTESAPSKKAAKATNPSPDSVECIDLTETSSNIHSFFRPSARKERRHKLGTIRKELQPSSAKKRKRAGLKTTGLDDNEVIVIDSDDDVPITCK